jgi:2-polyprenyl-3-methyl-5-hydroxy-6-metoxy-1,4-benzoquinol methylase
MKYYEQDDSVYVRLASEGKQVWDQQSDPMASFDQFILRPFLEEALAEIGPEGSGRRVMELGCGSGPISCFLAAKGFVVDGIDVSPQAIAMARQHAEGRGLRVNFTVADLCNLPTAFGHYDLIVDGHCLHYLVEDADRQKALAVVRGMLKNGGLFLVETMVWHEGMRIGQQYRYDQQGVLWLRVDKPSGVEAVEMDGAWYLPHRRIVPPKQVVRELRQAAFSVLFERVVHQKEDGKPWLLQARCMREQGV